MIFEQVRTGGCLSYLVACEATRAAIIVDPELDRVDHYLALQAEKGIRVRYVLDTHTHADHFSASHELARQLGVPIVMNRAAAAPYVDLRVEDGDTLIVGKLRFRVLGTPGHTEDSMCLVVEDRVLTGDTLLIGGTGRTDLPTGNPEALHGSLFDKLLLLDDALLVFPAHDYKDRISSSIGAEKSHNPRLQHTERAAFVAAMRGLDLAMPQHLTEALRTNRSGGKTVKQLIAEAGKVVPFMSMQEVDRQIRAADPDLLVLDVREKGAYEAGRLPGAHHIPRGELELRVDRELPDPTARIVTYCYLGYISTLAAATLRTLGYSRVAALDGGFDAWSKAGLPVEAGPSTPAGP